MITAFLKPSQQQPALLTKPVGPYGLQTKLVYEMCGSLPTSELTVDCPSESKKEFYPEGKPELLTSRTATQDPVIPTTKSASDQKPVTPQRLIADCQELSCKKCLRIFKPGELAKMERHQAMCIDDE